MPPCTTASGSLGLPRSPLRMCCGGALPNRCSYSRSRRVSVARFPQRISSGTKGIDVRRVGSATGATKSLSHFSAGAARRSARNQQRARLPRCSWPVVRASDPVVWARSWGVAMLGHRPILRVQEWRHGVATPRGRALAPTRASQVSPVCVHGRPHTVRSLGSLVATIVLPVAVAATQGRAP